MLVLMSTATFKAANCIDTYQILMILIYRYKTTPKSDIYNWYQECIRNLFHAAAVKYGNDICKNHFWS